MRPCLHRIKTRSVFVSGDPTSDIDKSTSRINVIDAAYSMEGAEVSRQENFRADGVGMGPINTGLTTALTLTQEVYGDIRHHRVLLEACGCFVTPYDIGVGAYVARPSAEPQAAKPCAIDLLEVGGNEYRLRNAVGSFVLTGEPAGRLLLTFTMVGSMVPVRKAVEAPFVVTMPTHPLIYKGARIHYGTPVPSTILFASAPAFSFSQGNEVTMIPEGNDPDGLIRPYLTVAAAAQWSLNGVVTVNELTHPFFALASSEARGAAAGGVLSYGPDKATQSFELGMWDVSYALPKMADTEGFSAQELVLYAPTWELRWKGLEGL